MCRTLRVRSPFASSGGLKSGAVLIASGPLLALFLKKAFQKYFFTVKVKTLTT